MVRSALESIDVSSRFIVPYLSFLFYFPFFISFFHFSFYFLLRYYLNSTSTATSIEFTFASKIHVTREVRVIQITRAKDRFSFCSKRIRLFKQRRYNSWHGRMQIREPRSNCYNVRRRRAIVKKFLTRNKSSILNLTKDKFL